MPSIAKPLTFGLELEIVKMSPQAQDLISRHHFGNHYDRTIRGRNGEALPAAVEDGGGIELITPPLSVGVECAADGANLRIDFGQTADVVRDLCVCAAEVNVSCGLHVHLGRPGPDGKSRWEPERVRTMLLVGMMLEQRLFSLCPISRKDNQYCKPILQSYTASDICKFYPMGDVAPRKYDNPKRYCWLNTIETRRPDRASSPATGTLEIRMLGNVRRFDYIWAWTKLWLNVAAYVAYVPTSLAIAHCVQSGSLDAAFRELESAKNIDRKKPAATKSPKSRAPVDRAPVDRRDDNIWSEQVAPQTPRRTTDRSDPNSSEFETWSNDTSRYFVSSSGNTSSDESE